VDVAVSSLSFIIFPYGTINVEAVLDSAALNNPVDLRISEPVHRSEASKRASNAKFASELGNGLSALVATAQGRSASFRNIERS
jgi:hypothetical protein